MRRLLFALLGLLLGYGAAALCSYGLALLLSGNSHDLPVEAAMGSAFVWGPLGGIAGLVAGLLWGRRR
ncbi:hypothetical protein [Pseudorhodoferax sp.]|uniref:hypothetical protein n=1 Tax=Pseudorhodoferax sp. TaxID=1993553 RepID=UPI002DD6396C|nr:hypothetical protein [Pseudorhodoferax sp.]